jgi:hypothetical protein
MAQAEAGEGAPAPNVLASSRTIEVGLLE